MCKLRCAFSFVLILCGMFMVVTSAEASESGDTAAAGAVSGRITAQGGDYLLQLFTGLIIVIICIVVLAWFARKMNRFQASGDGSLHILGGLSMGARERIVLIQVGEQQLLLGVSPGRINTLHVLDEDVTSGAPASQQTSSAFGKHLVDRMRQIAPGHAGQGDGAL